MTDTPLLVPSAARTIAFDTRPNAAAQNWPNKNAGDQLDYWIDCTGLLRDQQGGGSAVTIGAVVLQVVSGDASLVMVGDPTIQSGFVMFILAGGTPGAQYQLLATVQVQGSPALTYTRPITMTMTAAPAYGSAIGGSQFSGLLAGADISGALVTPIGGSQETLAALAGTVSTLAAATGGPALSSVMALSNDGTAGNAEVIDSGFHLLTEVAAGSAMIQKTGELGVWHVVANASANPIAVLPQPGGAWLGSAANAPYDLPPGDVIRCIAFSSTVSYWF